MANKITNTSKHEVNPLWLMGGNPNAIEDQEARGQQELVNSSQLPVEVRGKEKLEELGVVFGPPCEDDPLFCNASLPDGWNIKATDHSMHSDVIDSDGKVTATIFYKAAFYDRKAHMSFCEEK